MRPDVGEVLIQGVALRGTGGDRSWKMPIIGWVSRALGHC